MKIIKYLLILPTLLLTMLACNESAFLEEKSYIYDAETSLLTKEQFQQSLNYCYNRVRYLHGASDNADVEQVFFLGTDFQFEIANNWPNGKWNDYKSFVVPTNGCHNTIWEALFQIIGNANLILNRLPNAAEVADTDKDVIRGEALLLRAYAYRILAHCWGDVPIVKDEISTPRRDFVRDSRKTVYEFVRDDLKEAATLLPDIETARDGQANAQVAQHLLAEIYICLGEYQQAVDEASKVINHQGLSLMTERFGTAKDNTIASVDGSTGDVYWDLFRLNNQNYSDGNREGLWVLQYSNVSSDPGNGLKTTLRANALLENITINGHNMDGSEATDAKAFYGTSSTSYNANEFRGGRSNGQARPTHHFLEEIFDDTDIRGKGLNILRDLRVENPNLQEKGQWMIQSGLYTPTTKEELTTENNALRWYYPVITKVYRMFQYEETLYSPEGTDVYGSHILLRTDQSWRMNKDDYAIRLPETYLLRAEAYLNLNQKDKAATDINAVRIRAKATPVEASMVDIDYILDERLRELYYEELRTVTLCRLGKLYDRAKAYNIYTARTIEEYHNLWPIPYTVIERNSEVKWNNNPGY